MWCVLTLTWSSLSSVAELFRLWGEKVLSTSVHHLLLCIVSYVFVHFVYSFSMEAAQRSLNHCTRFTRVPPHRDDIRLFPNRNRLWTSEWVQMKTSAAIRQGYAVTDNVSHYVYPFSAINFAEFSSPELPPRNSSLVPHYWEVLLCHVPNITGLWIPHAVQIGSTSLTAWIMQLSEVGKSLGQRQMKIWNPAVGGRY